MNKILKTLFFSLIALSTCAIETFRHPTCNAYLHDFKIEKSWDKKFVKRLKSNLKSKGHTPQAFNKRKELTPGDFHVTLKRTLTGKVYKECLVEIIVKQSHSNRVKSEDTIIYKKESKRKFPRQTFGGQERCNLALDDLFFSMNICKTR